MSDVELPSNNARSNHKRIHVMCLVFFFVIFTMRRSIRIISFRNIVYEVIYRRT